MQVELLTHFGETCYQRRVGAGFLELFRGDALVQPTLSCFLCVRACTFPICRFG